MKLKYNVSNVCDDESLESEKGLGKTNKQTNKKKNTQAEEGKVEQRCNRDVLTKKKR